MRIEGSSARRSTRASGAGATGTPGPVRAHPARTTPTSSQGSARAAGILALGTLARGPPLVEAPRPVSRRGRVPDRAARAPLPRLRRAAPRPLEPPRAAADRRARRREPVPGVLSAGGSPLLRRLCRLRAGRRLAPRPAQARARRARLPRLLRGDAVPALHGARHAARSPRAVAGCGGRGHRRGRRRPLLPRRVVRRVRMTVPTPLIVLAGLLLVALILRLLVPSGVFTLSVGGTVGGTGVLGTSDLAKRADALVAEHFAANYAGDTSKLPQALGALLGPLRQLLASEGVQLDRQKLLTVVMVSAAKHRIATPAELQAAFDLLPP